MPGDSLYREKYDIMIKGYHENINKCHVTSKGFTETGCVRANNTQLVQATKMVNLMQNNVLDNPWPKLANNAPCVKETLTSLFW